jgi:pimeloyl-ACP methyl ester carboxylesterase
MPTIHSAKTPDGVVIAFEEEGSGPPVVLVHGITDNREIWDGTVSRLAGDFRCVRLDLRGHGQSGDAADLSPFTMASDVAAVVAELGLERPALVGHSLGAVVVTAYAASAPAACAVNVDQPLRFGDFGAALAPMEPALRGEGFRETMAAMFTAMAGDRLSPEAQAYVDKREAEARQDVVLGVWDVVFKTPTDELTAMAEQLLAGVTVPYLAIHGSDPGPGYEEWLTGLVPTATVEVWDSLGHFLLLADPDRFAARLGQFLADHR